MVAAFATALFFALSIFFAARSAHWLGSLTANLGRMLVALLLLALWAFACGSGVSGASFPFFFASGVVGFGIGDLALFQALPRIGPRLTILMTQCLAIPIAILVEQLWLGTRLRPAELFWIGFILAGVALALAPGVRSVTGRHRTPPRFLSGVFFGFLSAAGQGLGAVLSRKAYAVATLGGMTVDGGTAAFQRMLGGILLTGGFVLFRHWRNRPEPALLPFSSRDRWRVGSRWVFLNALAGPIFGIACYQHALATTPSGIVLPIVATSPIFAMGLTFLLDGERPSWLSVIGGCAAVLGAVALILVTQA